MAQRITIEVDIDEGTTGAKALDLADRIVAEIHRNPEVVDVTHDLVDITTPRTGECTDYLMGKHDKALTVQPDGTVDCLCCGEKDVH